MNRLPLQNWPVIAVTCSFAVILATVVWRRRRNSPVQKTKEEEIKEEGIIQIERLEEAERPEETERSIETQNPNETKSPKGNQSRKETESPKQTEMAKETENTKNNISKNEIVKEKPRNISMSGLHNPKWVKVGQVQELYMYPVKSGRGKDITECFFSEYGISVLTKKRFNLRDGMFVIYNEETGKCQSSKDYPTMILVCLSAVDEFKVKLEAVGMPSIVFTVPKDSDEKCEAVECKMWWGEPIKSIDCGSEAAEWLSRFLTGTNSGLRLGYTVMDRRSARKGLFRGLTSYVLMSSTSLDKLNEKLDKPVPVLQFRPNILIRDSQPFAEDSWEWIKIGERAIIRNVKPNSRPNVENMKQEELQKQTEAEYLSADGTSPLLGIHCGLYLTGKVKIGDDVFIHSPENFNHLNHMNGNGKSQAN